MNIDKIIHDKFITLLDKETINNISLLNHSLYGTLIDENYTFDFSKIANKVRDKLDNIQDINNQCFYDKDIGYWFKDKNGNLDSNVDNILDDFELDQVYRITSKEILSSILGDELYDTIY